MRETTAPEELRKLDKSFVFKILYQGRGILGIMAAVLFAVVFINIRAAISADITELRVGLYDFKPLTFVDTDGKAKGFFIDIMDDIAMQENWSVTYIYGDFNQCLTRLKKGEIDLIAGVAYSDERAKEFDFTKEHLFVIWAEIYTPEKTPIKTILDLKDKNIGVVKGAQVNRELKTLLEGFGIDVRFQEYKNYADVLKSLDTSESDAGVFTNLYGFQILETHPVERTQIFFAPTQLRFAVRKEVGQDMNARNITDTLDRYFTGYQADTDSIYYSSYKRWIEPSGMPPIPVKMIIPDWVYWLFLAFTLCFLLLIGFNWFLKRMVKMKTEEVIRSHEILRVKADALRESEEELKNQTYFLQKAQEIGHIGTWKLDIKKNELIWTQENYKIFGLPLGTPLTYEIFLNCVHPDDRDYVDREWKAAFNKKPYDIEHRLLVDGKVKWVREKAELEFDEKNECLRGTGFTQDITDWKLSELQFREAIERFKAVFNSQFDAIFVLNSEMPAFVLECNQAAVDIFGYASEDLIGDTVDKLHVDAAHLETFQKQLYSSVLKKGFLRDFEFSMKRKDGSIFPSDHTVMEMKNDSGRRTGWISIVRDLSKIKEAESALTESEATHRALVESLPDIVMRFDRDGRHLFVSENVCTVVDLQAAQFIGKTHQELGFPEAQCRFWEEAIQGVFDSGKSLETEFTFEGKTGPAIHNWRLIPEQYKTGRVKSVLSLSRDIGAQRRAEQDYKTLFREMLDGFALHEMVCNEAGEPVDYRFLMVNPAFERMTGLKAEEITGRTVLEVMPNTERHWIDTYGRVALTGEPMFFDNYSDALKKYFEVTAFRPLPNQFACIFQDITERKQTEAERVKLQAQLNQSQKMEAIGALAGGIAHDFNNILSPIVGHTEMLMDDFPDASSTRDSLKEIYFGALRARDLVQQILSFARQEENELKLMKLQPIIKEAMKLIRSTIPATVAIRQNLQSDCRPVSADPTQIHQIVMNLATNAYHAMEKNGGELKVDLKEIELGKNDLIHLDMSPGFYACLSFADTGVGMSRDVMSRIFEPFFTTKEKGKGTGMGLSVVHGIVKHMKGDIQVYSEPGKGTEFRVYLPVVGNAYEKQEPTADEPMRGGCERLLLVDDEAVIIAMEKQVLERLGYQVTSRTGSIEALETFRASPDKFDLVITDMSMPKMSGDKLADELMKIRPDIPVLLCTGFGDSMTDEKIKSLGLRGILMKPMMMKDLARKIREVLDTEMC